MTFPLRGIGGEILSEAERALLSRMNKVGIPSEIMTQKAAGILQRSESDTIRQQHVPE